MIEIHLYGKLRRFSEQKSPLQESLVLLKVLEGDTVHSITTRLGIPLKEMSSSIFLNGEYSGLERRVKDGDRLGLFPDNMILAYRQYFKKVDE